MPLSEVPLSSASEETKFRLQFQGRAGEYFGIWLANLSLSIITLGIYSPWAKVRRLKYFYQHTTLQGSNFDFHGDPFRILVGRIIAAVLFIIYSILTNLKSSWQFLAFGMALTCAPFIIQRALRFRLRSTSFRGLRFNFIGSIQGALINAILLPIVSAIPLGLTYPFGLREWRRYQLSNATYGKTKFGFDSQIFPFYMMVIAPIAPFTVFVFGAIGLVLAIGNGSQSPIDTLGTRESFEKIGPLVVFIAGALLFSIYGIYTFYKHRLIFNGLTLGNYKFRSTITFWPCIYITASNGFLSALTLGLYRPFAAIRAARLQIDNIEVSGPADISSFIGENTLAVSALGTETIDFFDFDIGL